MTITLAATLGHFIKMTLPLVIISWCCTKFHLYGEWQLWCKLFHTVGKIKSIVTPTYGKLWAIYLGILLIVR
jgi:hypothetical protein